MNKVNGEIFVTDIFFFFVDEGVKQSVAIVASYVKIGVSIGELVSKLFNA